MRVVKLALISFIVLFLLLFAMSMFIPSTVRVSRATNMHAGRDAVRPYIDDLSRWPLWNDMTGQGIKITVLRSEPGMVALLWEHAGKTAECFFRMEESAGITVVNWYFDFRLKWYPWEKFGSIALEKQFGMAMESSLENLKRAVENSP